MKLLCLLLMAVPFVPGFAAAPMLALGDGEVLTYRVAWALLPGAGEIKISARKEIGVEGPQLRVITTTRTRGLGRMLLPFDGHAESIFDVRSGRILSLFESNQTRGKHTEHRVTFDYERAQANYVSAQAPNEIITLPLPTGTSADLITSLLQTRCWNLQPGEKHDALVIFGRDFYDLTLYAEHAEEIRTPLGTFQTVLLVPKMEKTPPKGMFKRGHTARVWIANDTHRLPVRFEVEFKIGTGTATLIDYRPPQS